MNKLILFQSINFIVQLFNLLFISINFPEVSIFVSFISFILSFSFSAVGAGAGAVGAVAVAVAVAAVVGAGAGAGAAVAVGVVAVAVAAVVAALVTLLEFISNNKKEKFK